MRCAHCNKLIQRAAAAVETVHRKAGSSWSTTEHYGPKCAAMLGLIIKSHKTKPVNYKRNVKGVFSKSTLEVQDGQESLFEDVA